MMFCTAWIGGNFLSVEILTPPAKISRNLVALGARDLLSVLKLLLPKGGIEQTLAKLLCLLLAGGVRFLPTVKLNVLSGGVFAQRHHFVVSIT